MYFFDKMFVLEIGEDIPVLNNIENMAKKFKTDAFRNLIG